MDNGFKSNRGMFEPKATRECNVVRRKFGTSYPGHFLTQGPILLPPQENEISMAIGTRWTLVQRIQLLFWKRWSLEYISTLQTRKKWIERNKNIAVNVIVLVREENLPPCRWLMGRVMDIPLGQMDWFV